MIGTRGRQEVATLQCTLYTVQSVQASERLRSVKKSSLRMPLHLFLDVQHCNENPINVFLFWELCGLSPNFHVHVSACVCQRFIDSQDPSTYFPAAEQAQADQSWEYECGNQDCGRAIPFLAIFVSNFRYCVFVVSIPLYFILYLLVKGEKTAFTLDIAQRLIDV